MEVGLQEEDVQSRGTERLEGRRLEVKQKSVGACWGRERTDGDRLGREDELDAAGLGDDLAYEVVERFL
jgi:hypothetical protein